MHILACPTKALICFLFCLAAAGVPVCEAFDQVKETKKIDLVFRYDDYSSQSDTAFEARLIRLFLDHGIKLTMGVVPFMVEGDETDPTPRKNVALSQEKADLLLEGIAGGVLEVAQHGYSHKTYKKFIQGNYSEFRDMPMEKQIQIIREGRSFLEELLVPSFPLQVFIPPFNHYDKHTLSAVEQAGFTVISPGLYSMSPKQAGLIILPETTDLPGLKSAIMAAEGSPCSMPLVMTLFHPDDFAEINPAKGNIDEAQFKELLAWVSSKPNIRSLFISEAAQVQAYDTTYFRKNKTYFLTYRLIWPRIRSLLKIQSGYYICSPELGRQQAKVWVFLSVYVVVILAAMMVISRMLFGYILNRLWIPGLFAFALTLLFSVFGLLYILKDASLTHLGFTLILLAAGTVLGGLGVILRKQKPYSG